MPKEQVNFPQPVFTHHSCTFPPDGECTCTPTWDSRPALFVRWNNYEDDRTGVVQLSLEQYPSFTNEEYEAQRQWPPAPERELYSENLTRSELNKLIKFLRRARDQAYGTDE